METTLRNDYAFSNAVVKFCEIFSCPMCKEHETKLGFFTFDCFLYTICLLYCDSLLLDCNHMSYTNANQFRINAF